MVSKVTFSCFRGRSPQSPLMDPPGPWWLDKTDFLLASNFMGNYWWKRTLQHWTRVEPTPVKCPVLSFLCTQTQQRPLHFSSCWYLSDISTGARKLVCAVCTFPLWRKVRGFGL